MGTRDQMIKSIIRMLDTANGRTLRIIYQFVLHII